MTTLPEGYTLAEGVAALEVTVRFEEPEVLAGGTVSSEEELKTVLQSAQSGDIITLAADIDVTKPITISGQNITLNLNKKTLTYSGNGSGYVPYGVFTLKSGNFRVENGTLKGQQQNKLRCFNVTGGTLTIEKVTIQNFSCQGGGAISIDSVGTCIMKSGTISGNSAWDSEGGGVYVRGTFNMHGGTISGNNVSNGNGGGVYVYSNGTFNMNGGTISGNGARSGGGVYVYSNGIFTMNGGEIRNNKAEYDSYGEGGGVKVSSGTFTMTGGTISGNTAKENGGGVYVDKNSFTMNGGTITNNTANAAGGGVCMYSGSFTMSCGSITSNQAGGDGKGVSIRGSVSYNLSGTAKITDNTGNGTGNLYINGGNAERSITNLTTGARLDISFSRPGDMKVATGDQGSLEYLTCENQGYVFTLENSNELWVKLNRMEINTPPTGQKGLTYDGSSHKLVSAGTAGTGGTMLYAVTLSGIGQPGKSAFSKELPSREDAGKYTVWYYAKDDGGKADSDVGTLEVTIAPKPLNVKWDNTNLTYNGSPQQPTAKLEGKIASDSVNLEISNPKTDAGTYQTENLLLSGQDAGNYVLAANQGTRFTIEPVPLTITAKPKTITYGEAPANDGVTCKGFVDGETVEKLNGTLGYTYNYVQYGDVGSYTITPGGLTSQNYKITFKVGRLTVNPKTISINWGDTTHTYDGNPWAPTPTAEGMVNDDALTLTVTGQKTDAGDYTATATVTGIQGDKAKNYKLPDNPTASFTIDKADAQFTPPTAKEGLIYDGSDQPLVTAGSSAHGTFQYWLDGEQPSESIPQAKDAGTYTVHYQLMGDKNHKDGNKETLTVTIAPKDITGATVTLGESPTYNGREQTQRIASVKVGGLDVTYDVTDNTGTNAGTYTMTLTGKVNFTGTATKNWNIAPKNITGASVTLKEGTQTYTGQKLTNDVTGVTIDGLTLDKGDYTVTGETQGTNKGTYTLTVTAKDSSNFTGSASATWQIQKATDNEWTTTPTVTGWTYGETPNVNMGAAKFGTVTVSYTTKDGNTSFGETVPTNAGDYQAVFTVAETGNYSSLSETVDFTISKKTLTVTAEAKTAIYGDAAPAYTVTYQGFATSEDESKLGGPLTFTCDYAPGKDVGSYDITPGGLTSDNYDIQYEPGTLTVSRRVIEYQWGNLSLTYNGQIQAPTAIATNAFDKDALTLEVTGGAVDAGRHTATIQRIIGDKAGNYTLPPNHSTVFFIDKATPTVTAPRANTLTYDGTAQTLAKDGSTNGGTLVYSLEENGTYSKTIPTGTEAGDYTVWYKVQGNNNYMNTQAQRVDVTIAPKDISDATVTLGADLTYNGEELTKEVKTVTVEGLNVTYKVTGNTGKDAKNYTMTLRGTGNFTGTTKANWSIAQKSIQGATVSLGDKLIYSGVDQTQNIASVTVSGVTGEVTYKVTGNTGKDAKDYTMTLEGTGNFTGETKIAWSIAKKDVTIQGVAVASKVYDGTANAAITDNGTLSANFDGENLTFHVGTAAYDDKNAGADKTVTFTGFRLEGSAAGNYRLSGQPEDTTASITQKPAKLTVTPKDKTYDGTLTAELDTVTHSGFVAGDDVQLVNGTPSFVSKDKGEKVQLTFTPFTLTGKDAGNYALTQPTGVEARITPRPVTVSGIAAQDKTYDGNTQVTFDYGNARLEGNVDGDKLTVTAEGAFEDANVGDKLVNITGLTLGGAEQGNYVLAEQGQQTTATAAITANDRYLDLSGVDLGGDGEEAWIDGEKLPINTDGGSHMLLPEEAEFLTTYTYSQSGGGNGYPTGMKVYRIEEKDTGAVLTEIPEFENLLNYAGCSIRLTGTKGIRMITGVNEAKRTALIGAQGLAGYTLEEYGTVVMRGVGTPTLENSHSHNFAYKKGKADPVFGRAGGTVQYTNVLVGFSLEDCKDTLTLRPYVLLKDIATGETVTFYGGCVSRSIGYIAKQNENTYQPGTAGYKYIHEIIDAVYGKTEQGGETK